ncbi:MAG: element excision factor XisH family protein [Caldilineaceae bacterium]
MSRRDYYHKIVRQALTDEGWHITDDPYYFESDPELSTDLGAERIIAAERNTEKIAVEIKSFLNDSQVYDLQRAIGQYGLYEELLILEEPERVLYLAVPKYAFDNIFARQVGRIAIRKFNLRLIVYGSEGEALRWIKP